MNIKHVAVSMDPFTWGKVAAVLEIKGYDGIADEIEDQVAPLFDEEDD